MEKVNKFPSRTGSLFIKEPKQDPPENYFTTIATWKKKNTTKFEGYFRKIMNPNETNTLNNIFENINANKAMKYSSFKK